MPPLVVQIVPFNITWISQISFRVLETEALLNLKYKTNCLREHDHWRIQGGCQGHVPPLGSKFFHFHAVFGKNVKNNSNFGSWHPPLGKILDPPLMTSQTCCSFVCPSSSEANSLVLERKVEGKVM